MVNLKTRRIGAALSLCAALAGCNINSNGTETIVRDTGWANDQLRFIVNTQRYSIIPTNLDGGRKMVGQDWTLITVPFPERPGRAPNTRQFLKMGGSYDHYFHLIGGSDLLIHQTGVVQEQYVLFDPVTGKDISKPFPGKSVIFNRSRTAYLTLVDGKIVTLDTLSARTGEPKVLAQPPWAQFASQMFRGRAILTEDAQHLVLLPPQTLDARNSDNLKVEVLSMDGSKQSWSIPLQRKEETFVDAEAVDGKIILFSRRLLPNGAEDEVKLINMQGETLQAATIDASIMEQIWNPLRHEIFFPYQEFSPTNPDPQASCHVWDYHSNVLQKIVLGQVK